MSIAIFILGETNKSWYKNIYAKLNNIHETYNICISMQDTIEISYVSRNCYLSLTLGQLKKNIWKCI